MTDLFKDAIEQRQRAADADDASLPPSSLFPGLIVIGLLSAAIVVASIAEGYFTFYRVFERTPSQRIIRGCLAAIIVVVEIISMAFIVRSSSSRKQTSKHSPGSIQFLPTRRFFDDSSRYLDHEAAAFVGQ